MRDGRDGDVGIRPGWLSPKQVCARLGIHERTLQRWVSKGIFPQPKRVTRNTVRWPVRVVEEFEQGEAKRGRRAMPA